MPDESQETTVQIETPATEEQTEELQTVAEQILARTNELCQSQPQLSHQMETIQSELQNMRAEQTNNRERLNQIVDLLESLQSPPSTRSQSVTPETTPQTETVVTVPSVEVDPQEVRTETTPKQKRKFRAI